jgi:hypothetical protein
MSPAEINDDLEQLVYGGLAGFVAILLCLAVGLFVRWLIPSRKHGRKKG